MPKLTKAPVRFENGFNDTHHYRDVKRYLSGSTIEEIENFHRGIDEDELSLLTPSIAVAQDVLMRIIKEWQLPQFTHGNETITVVTYDWLDNYRLGGHGRSSWGF